MRHWLGQSIFLALGGLLIWVGTAQGEPLWKQLTARPRVDADPAADYRLTESNGPWLIMAATFSGDGAVSQARALVQEIRSEHNLAAYVYRMTFDLAADAPMRGVDRYGRLQRAKYQRGDAVTEYAVLVGDFPNVEDDNAQAILQRIKKMDPKSLSGKHIDRTTQNLAGLRAVQNVLLSRLDKSRKRGPMGHAFITRNPLLPDEYFVPRGVDPFVEKMNRGVQYSLLDCPGRYTVKVATFRGRVFLQGAMQGAMQSSHVQKVSASQQTDPLIAAAENANKLTRILREKSWEAYEFHNRDESIVTIGSFDQAMTQLPNGQEIPKQDIQTIIRTFGAAYEFPTTDPRRLDAQKKAEEVKQRFKTFFAKQHGAITSGFHPKSIGEIPFDIHPQVMEVPRRSLSSDYIHD